MKAINLPHQNVTCKLKNKNLIIEIKEPFKTISSAIYNGGICSIKTILNHQVPMDFNNPCPESYIADITKKLNLVEPVIGLLTAANTSNVSVKTRIYAGNEYVSVLATAGVSNSITVGDETDLSCVGIGTINLIVLIDGNLTDGCLVETIKTITEAKTVALRELDVRSISSKRVATGTTTDAVVVTCTGKGKKNNYAGAATDLGRTLSITVIEAVKDALRRDGRLTAGRLLSVRLEEVGITTKDIMDAIMEHLVYHPSMGSKEKIMNILQRELGKAMSDVNIASLILAGMRLEEDGRTGLIPGIDATAFATDPVFLLADEILGLGIANYIAGSRGVFEFVRFDKNKPGIIKKLGPFMDDVIGGIAAGASSNMYTKLSAKRKQK